MQVNKSTILFWIKQIVKYFRNIKFKIDPLPEFVLIGEDEQKNDPNDVLITTGGYQPATQMLYLYISNRHLKDILRSFCHEMIHHHQYLENQDYIRRIYKIENVYLSEELKEIESEAYLLGNIHFREFTEKFKNKEI